MNGLVLLLIVAAVVSAIGWYRFLYFISVGYAFSILACGIAMVCYFHGTLTPETICLLVLFMVYGCRLGGFLLYREFKSASYRKELPNLTKTSRPVTVPFKLVIWVSVVLLYVMEVSPVYFRLENMSGYKARALARAGYYDPTWAWVGVGVMIFALIFESLADYEKSKAKAINPKRFCDIGLYRIVRCPNYLGEVLFWTGCFISGIGSLNSAFQWIFASIGYLSIVYIMFGGARRLELRQNKNYGADPEYQAYVEKTPILIPLIPLYRLEKYTWLKG